jgi:hypothetical protein
MKVHRPAALIARIALIAGACGLAACGKSLYGPLTPESSDESLREKAILALNGKDFGIARTALSKIWDKDKSNGTTQLYANAILGSAGFDLYEIIVNLLKGTDASKLKSANDILDALSEAITVEATTAQLDELKFTLTVLDQASNQKSQALEFQKCLTVGIYALPVLNGITQATERIQQTLDALPTKLEVNGSDGRSCQASSDTISSVGADLTATISEVGAISQRISEITEVVNSCSLIADSSATANVNAITKKVTNVVTLADKGCSVPETGALGSRIIPSCMTSFIEETATGAAANDGSIAGCEIFLNCSSGKCLTSK